MNSTCYHIHLRPTVVLKNCLPIKIIVCGQDSIEETLVEPGENIHLSHVEPGNSYLVIRVSKPFKNTENVFVWNDFI